MKFHCTLASSSKIMTKAPQKLGRQLIRTVGRRQSYHAPTQSTYNDLPQPSGSWKTTYDANQRKYTAHLAIGVGSLVGTLIFGKAAGFLEFYNDIPEKPAQIDSYK
ncbi:unnamed protein product [Acanthoscelides obtectus]|uniref:Deltamethrin resistance protein prag01 domain-containing protein n=1 Tax=Acanthoscelides obtectus TaxID=200917 RepID=A0A9P0LF66_ACAOB|nr:unnamed protein product [Acanthoscelides obtectus]CAK1640446.1 hypothetical protein AOBTE_LOCUS11726 [Acanthoscelides obtectus]